MLPCDRPEKPKKTYTIPKVSKKRAAAIADGTFKPKERKPLQSSFKAPLKKRSKKREAQERLYSTKTRPECLAENPICGWCKRKNADQLHHKKGRIGDLLNDKRYIITLCHDCHVRAEMNPNEAKAAGISLSRLN